MAIPDICSFDIKANQQFENNLSTNYKTFFLAVDVVGLSILCFKKLRTGSLDYHTKYTNQKN